VDLLDPPIDAVLLDAGGVLVLPDPEALRKGMAPFGLSPGDEVCARAHYESMAEVDRIGATDWPVVDRVFARAAGVEEEDVDAVLPVVEDLYLNHPFVPVPGAAEALLDLQAGGFALAIVSNATGTVERQLADHRICSVDGGEAARVGVVVDSSVVGIEKPDPGIFHIALEALGVPPEQALYVGDTVHFDVHGARAAGMRCVHIDPLGRCPATDHPHAAALHDLAQVLRAA
jgi:putative hydrolase of the HAD superfamily